MYRQGIRKACLSLMYWRDFRLKIFVEGIVIGLVAGAVVALFRYMLEQSELWRDYIYSFLISHAWQYTAGWFAVLLVVAVILSVLLKLEPMASGSGIPQVKGILLGIMKMKWLSVIICKLIGGTLAIGAGLSLGREGPSIQLGAAVGQGLSRLLGRMKLEERYLLTSGASAGLAAAFNAPLAGAMFSFEELHKNFSPAVLMTAVAAAVTADVVAQQCFGYSPVFTFPDLPVLPVAVYGWILLLGILIGVFGLLFNFCLLRSLDLYERTGWPMAAKAGLALLVAGVLGFYLPEVLGGGNRLVNSLSYLPGSIGFVCMLLVGKFMFTMLSYGSGVPGGIFLPLLVLGALTGDIYGQLLAYCGVLPAALNGNFIVLAMAAAFASIVKAPLTGSILIMEMTGSFQHMLPLIAVSMTAYVTADVLRGRPVYEALLLRSLSKQGRVFATVRNKRMVIEVPIALGAPIEKKAIRDVDWPSDALIVSIRRGEQELVPQGDTRLFAGDYLYVLATVGRAERIKALAGKQI